MFHVYHRLEWVPKRFPRQHTDIAGARFLCSSLYPANSNKMLKFKNLQKSRTDYKHCELWNLFWTRIHIWVCSGQALPDDTHTPRGTCWRLQAASTTTNTLTPCVTVVLLNTTLFITLDLAAASIGHISRLSRPV